MIRFGEKKVSKSRKQGEQSEALLEELCRNADADFRSCPIEDVTGRKHAGICLGCQSGGCENLRALGLDETGNPLPVANRPRCGAKNRKGSSCKLPVEAGKRRCRFQGAASTGPKTLEGRERIAEAQRKRWARRR